MRYALYFQRRAVRWIVVLGVLVLTACAALENAGRPSYDGPLHKPLWHVADIEIADQPIVSAGVVYAIGQPWGTSTYRMYAVDAKTGTLRWSASTKASHLVAVAGPTIFASGSGVFEAHDSRNGRAVRNPLPQAFSAIAFADGVTYAAAPNKIVAVDTAGTVKWSRALPVNQIRLPPVVAGRNVYVTGVNPHLDRPDAYGAYAFDRATGAQRWQIVERYPTRLIEGVLADERRAYVREWLQSKQIFLIGSSVVTVDAATGKPQWERRSDGCTDAPNLLETQWLIACAGYVGDGTAYQAFDRRTGIALWRGVTGWNYDSYAPFGIYAVVADRRVHQVLNENNDKSYDSFLTFVDRRSGRELWRSPMLTLADSTKPAIGGGIGVVGSKAFSFNDIHGARDVTGLWAWRLQP